MRVRKRQKTKRKHGRKFERSGGKVRPSWNKQPPNQERFLRRRENKQNRFQETLTSRFSKSSHCKKRSIPFTTSSADSGTDTSCQHIVFSMTLLPVTVTSLAAS